MGGCYPRIVIDRPERRSRDDLANQVATAIRLRQVAGDHCRVAIAVRPHHPMGVRAHLSQIAGLRMQASEWDIDIALDLTREVDWLWEAEASIYRMFSSLELVRIGITAGTLGWQVPGVADRTRVVVMRGAGLRRIDQPGDAGSMVALAQRTHDRGILPGCNGTGDSEVHADVVERRVHDGAFCASRVRIVRSRSGNLGSYIAPFLSDEIPLFEQLPDDVAAVPDLDLSSYFRPAVTTKKRRRWRAPPFLNLSA